MNSPVSEQVTIGVPIYRGERYLDETLRAIQAQTHRNFTVLMSLDGPDPVCEAICSRYLADERFRLTIQPARLGWVGNLNWLLGRVSGGFWYFHQQDDLTEPTYLGSLLTLARANPAAALVYCDVQPISRISVEVPFQAPSVQGTPFIRQITMLNEHLAAFAFRGLTKAEAVRAAGPVPTNAACNFGVDITWLAAVARSGELLRLPVALYSKRYHDRNTESGWWEWPEGTKLDAWTVHCTDMLKAALAIEVTVEQARLLFLAATARLVSVKVSGPFLHRSDFTNAERTWLLRRFLDLLENSSGHYLEAMLGMRWANIRRLARSYAWMPSSKLDIVAFGPQPVALGAAFNTQPDGHSAIWLRTSQPSALGWSIEFGGVRLETCITGTLLTARVPQTMLQRAGGIPFRVIDSDGNPRSKTLRFVLTGDARPEAT